MKTTLNKISSGLPLIDQSWGGLYRGGTYLLIGPRKSGRSLFALQFAMEAMKEKEICLYFTGMRQKDVDILAASINFDIQQHREDNELILVRVQLPDIPDTANPDSFLVEYFNDIISVVEQYQPDRFIFDELTPFIGFENVNLLQQTFLRTVETIEEKNTTSLFILSEPATPFTQSIVDDLAQHVTGIVYLQKNSDGQPGGRATITPNIGHTEGQFVSNYHIQPYKGITFDVDSVPLLKDLAKKEPEKKKTSEMASMGFREVPKSYSVLADIKPLPDQFYFSNLYDINEFTLILNNQIALYKSTGQGFTLLSFKLDQLCDKENLLKLTQLSNSLRLSVDKKDKLCMMEDTILLLLSRNDEKVLPMLASKLRGNLPALGDDQLERILRYTYVREFPLNDSIQNAQNLLALVLN